MIGFVGLMGLLGGLAWLGGYWISWETEDVRTRPPFTTRLFRDGMKLMRRRISASADRGLQSSNPRSKRRRVPQASV